MARGGKPNGWLLFDNTCGFCRAVVPRGAWLEACGLRAVPLQERWIQDKTGLGEEVLMEEMHIVLEDGRRFAGADAYRLIFRRVWYLFPFYLLSILPGLRGIFDSVYRKIAANRGKISRVCRLDDQ